MTVSCPDCTSVFRVDPAKVPATGGRARCSVCGGVISLGGGTVPISVTLSIVAPHGAPAEAEQARAVPRSPEVAAPTARPDAAAPVASPEGKRPINPFLRADPAQRARRLARALVSDLVAYHPQKREAGLRDGTLRQLFREEIKKSYEEYVEQVGQDVAAHAPYFQDALNEVLAGGRRLF